MATHSDALHILYIILMASQILGKNTDTFNKTTPLGTLQGYSENVLDKDIHIFLGIPFAKPPMGQRRFRKPEPAGEWPGTLDATKLPNSCPQGIETSFNNHLGVTMWNANTEISEDCLYLNIWTPSSAPPSGGRPIMVWIHGGGFFAGTSTLDVYDGRILAALGNIVIVSIQYRLGPLGFLTLGTEQIPGNMGLHDQVLALKWIQENIGDYGGNPNRVTIFGASAGAASVGLHLLFPYSRDLFERAILQAGSVLSSWAVKSHRDALQDSLNIAAAAGCKVANLDELPSCLLRVPHEVFSGRFVTAPRPTVDGDFLPKHPNEIIRENKFKKTGILLGFNKNEGTYFALYALPDIRVVESRITPTKEEFREAIINFLETDNPMVLDLITFEYREPCNYKRGRGDYMDILDNVLGDYDIKCPVVNFAKAYANAGESVYVYECTHHMSSNPWPDWMGVVHGAEIDAVFGAALNQSLSIFSEEERQFSTRVAQHWINFAVSGDPSLTGDQTTTPYTWPAYTASDRNVLVLNLSVPATIRDGIRDRECAFWDTLEERGLMHSDDTTTCGCVSYHISWVAMVTFSALCLMFCSPFF